MLKDISGIEDIKLLVNSFYENVRKNELLSPIFNNIIKDAWDTHLEKMYSFWQTVLLDEHTYYGSPFMPHAELPVDKHHFDTWLELFRKTIDTHFQGEKAEEAKWRAEKMAQMFYFKIDHHRKNTSKPLF
ncbi:group III truncated hemoglobin [Zhouia spongiae]|uniref:Group III truncated hemoglobin n=1 Tax=Zhouia spongiae TaxID=2202721 RepID=A0ABY3YRN2_9FLAO|nr:group III truncated hemoglobin [Zhouia spongiae]UNZ00506.1 group III truncated hemoglobin [Zhouia spongiae]